MKNDNYQNLIQCLHVEIVGVNNKFTWDRVLRRYFRNHNVRYIFWWRIASYLFHKGGKHNDRRAYSINRKLISKYGIEIELGASIAPGITFAHFQGTVISRASTIGKNLHIRQNTTIGIKNAQENNKIIIGDNVSIGANCCIIGEDLTIGNNVTIGAMAFINQNVPDNSICYTTQKLNIKTKPHKLS